MEKRTTPIVAAIRAALEPHQTLRQVGKKLGLSPKAVLNAERSALEKLAAALAPEIKEEARGQ